MSIQKDPRVPRNHSKGRKFDSRFRGDGSYKKNRNQEQVRLSQGKNQKMSSLETLRLESVHYDLVAKNLALGLRPVCPSLPTCTFSLLSFFWSSNYGIKELWKNEAKETPHPNLKMS